MKLEDQIKRYKAKREITQKEIDKVLSQRSTGSRARAAYDLWLRLNPKHRVSFSDGTDEWLTAKQIHQATIEKVQFLRENQDNKFGTNKSASMRLALELPPHAAEFMKMFHPDIFDNDDYAKTRFRKLIKQFPEFQVMEVV